MASKKGLIKLENEVLINLDRLLEDDEKTLKLKQSARNTLFEVLDLQKEVGELLDNELEFQKTIKETEEGGVKNESNKRRNKRD